MPNFEILPSFLHFHFAVFVDDHGACSVKHVAAAEKGVGVWSVSSVCAWCMKGKKGVCKTSNHPFNFLFIFVCVYHGSSQLPGYPTKHGASGSYLYDHPE